MSSSAPPDGSRPSDSTFPSAYVPRMGAESGYQLIGDEEIAPLRWSGFLALLTGLISFTATVAVPMMVVPVIAIALGLFARRKYTGAKPVGMGAASLGLVLAAGFGGCGLFIHSMKRATLGGQAEYFAREFLEICERGDFALAMELRKAKPNRQLGSTAIDDVYRGEGGDFGGIGGAEDILQDLRNGVFGDVNRAAGKTQWELDGRVRVFQQWGNEKAEMIWVDRNGVVPQPIQIEMTWQEYPGTDRAEWMVSLFQFYRERIVAPIVQ